MVPDRLPPDLVQQVEELVSQLADHYQALVDAVNQFLRAESFIESGRLLDAHPELLEDEAARVIQKCIQDADADGDIESARRLRERQNYLRQYRRTAGQQPRDPGTIPRPGECPYDEHVWEASQVSTPRYQSWAMRCGRCHVGHVLELTLQPDGAVDADYSVFPADGFDTISQQVRMWAIMTCENTIREMEADGMPVRRGTPTIGWRPESLAQHTDFRPLG